MRQQVNRRQAVCLAHRLAVSRAPRALRQIFSDSARISNGGRQHINDAQASSSGVFARRAGITSARAGTGGGGAWFAGASRKTLG